MDSAPGKSWRLAASLPTLAAFAFFCWHGIWRGLSGGGYDLAMLYAGSAAWADGGDPYLLADATAAMAARGGELDPTSIVLYPPSALAAFAPLTLLGWKVARIVWVGVQLLSFVGLAAGLQKLAGDKLRRGLAGWLFVMALLLWWPIHTGLFTGQVALPVAALVVWAVIWAGKGNRWWAGLVLGLALAVKPQLAVAGLGVLLWQERRNIGPAVGAIGVAATFFVVGVWPLISRMMMPGLTSWVENMQAFANGGYGDVSVPWARAQMLQASTLFAAGGVSSAAAYGAALAAFLGCFWFIRQWPRRKQVDALEVLSILSLLTLLAVYHRSYDAVLALIPLAHGLRLIAADRRSVVGWVVVAALAVFLTPGGTALTAWSPAGAWWVQFQTMGLVAAMIFMLFPSSTRSRGEQPKVAVGEAHE